MQETETKIVCPLCKNVDNEQKAHLLLEDMLLITYSCPHCHHVWTDIYMLVYSGYKDKTGYYDRDGLPVG